MRLVVAFAASVALTATSPSTATAAVLKLTPHIVNHSPVINKKWPIVVDVTRGKARLSGTVSYEFLFSGAVVSTQKGHAFTGGVYRDAMVFPAASLGQPLTLRIVVKTKYGSGHIDWNVTPKK